MRVADLMTKSVARVHANESCSEAVRLMWDCDCGAIPVIDETARVLGMITDRDICMAAWSKNVAPSAIGVSEAMSKDLYSCSPDDTLATAESIMRSRQIRRVPVLDARKQLVGILSLADVARQAQPGRAARGELAPDEVASTLANICQPAASAQPGVGLR